MEGYTWVKVEFDLNYVGCEHALRRNDGLVFRVWSELCGMWTIKEGIVAIRRMQVWSELCGMWTAQKRHYEQPQQRFDLNYVGCEPSIAGILDSTTTIVWSELCGMWTMRTRWLCKRFSSLIWTMWDVNKTLWCASSTSRKKFDLNYVGCERDNTQGFLLA